MYKHFKTFCFFVLCVLFCKRINSYNNIKINIQWKLINRKKTQSTHSILSKKKRKNVLGAQNNMNLEKIKQLRKVSKEIKKKNILEINEEEKQKREKETTAWKVILYNDDIHNFTHVTDVIVKVIEHISKAKAHTITVKAHSTGQALICSTWKAQAEKYCEELQKNGLTVSIIHESQLKSTKNKSDTKI
ncbi:ATP-dependent Clp protease adapter protein ClpS, putative [Hepatocystis sp. ex Piliocolobus tephrosceles]|nr:ATP-dependent Clp protease adapter protein ClpS, putative [Hepatocystis sp. ex Piliocolobus tephrosceles]